jgi:hypothetical protein
MAKVEEAAGPATEALGEALHKADQITEEAIRAVATVDRRVAVIGIALATAGGIAIGWYVCERKLRKKYEQRAEEEIEGMRDHFRQRLVARQEVKPEISELGKRAEELGYSPTPPVPPQTPGDLNTAPGVEARDQVNIFAEAEVNDTWDYEVEKAQRDPSRPYVIHVDERGETGYEEVTLTYYSGDDVICDHNDKIVDDQDRVVGHHNLNKFGHGSGDAVIVYIRNEYLDLDIELIRSEQSYAEEVHGITHADSPRRRERPEWQ